MPSLETPSETVETAGATGASIDGAPAPTKKAGAVVFVRLSEGANGDDAEAKSGG